MSGLNKRRKLFKKQLFIILVIYVIILISTVVLALNADKINNKMMLDKANLIKKDVNKLISIQEDEHRTAELNKLVDSQEINLIIKDNKTLIFSNTPITDIEVVQKSIPKDQIFYSGSFTADTNSEYTISLVVYNKTFAELINTIIIMLIILLVIMSIGVAIVIRLSFKSLLNPLDSLYNNLIKLKEYKFDGILSTDEKTDIFVEELQFFVKDISGKINDFEIVYTKLEKELMLQNQKANYKSNIATSLVHDIKTPLNIIKLSLLRLDSYKVNDEILLDIEESTDTISDDVEEILHVINKSDIVFKEVDIDLIAELKKAIRKYNKLWDKKNLSCMFDSEDNIFVHGSEVELASVINNAFSNIFNYAKPGTDIEISAYSEDNNNILKISNEVSNINDIDFEKAFDLFYSVNDNNSSGFGMFIIKTFMSDLKGDYFFYQENNRVVLKLVFPKRGNSHE